MGVGVELPITLQQNVFLSVVRAQMEGEFRQTRFYGDAVDNFNAVQPVRLPTAFRDRITLTPRLVLGYRLQQNPRDLVPNTGLIWGSVAELDAWTDGIGASRALTSELSAFLPIAPTTHTGLEVGAGLLTQNRASIFDTDAFVPRGYEDAGLPEGTFLRFDAELTQPLWYIDDGWSLVPLYVKSLGLYGFGQTLGRVDGADWNRTLTSVGGGIDLRLRLFYLADLTLRLGAAYRVEKGDVAAITR
jgi:hypothetical protein